MQKYESAKAFENWLSSIQHFYVYGAGYSCQKLLDKLAQSGQLNKVKSILVTDKNENVKSIHGISVLEFNKELNTLPIVLAVSEPYKNEIINHIKENGFTDVAYISIYIINSIYSHINFEHKKIEIQKLAEYANNNNTNTENIDILFVSPPYWDVYSPFSAVPCLMAKLVEEGFTPKQFDAGIHCIHHLIDKRWKSVAKSCISLSFYNTQIKNYIENPYSTYENYKNDMWFFNGDSFDVFNVKQHYYEFNPVQKRVVDAFYNHIYKEDTSNIDFDSCNDLKETINNWNVTELLETLQEPNVIRLFENVPSVVGISITSTSQFIPGCVLAEIFKACRPDVTIVMGGSCADVFAKSAYEPKTDIFNYFDYIIIGEGETALTKLMHYIKGNEQLESIPNLMYLNENKQISINQQLIENASILPIPNYDGLDLELYLAPEIILPYQASRGCHYGQCAFCNHDEKYRHNYRTKQMDKVVNELLQLSKKYNVKHFQFVDEAIRPDCFETMIDEMEKHEEFKDIKWFYYSRVSRRYSKELLLRAQKNGCKMVLFGVESFNQRLLRFIKKGISADTSRYCLKLFHECGIKTYAWLMCNLPSETLEEAREDLNAVKEMQNYIDAFSVGAFYLSRNTDMYANPENYNITKIDAKNPMRFHSHNNGVIIDKDAMLSFWKNEYAQYQKEMCGPANRYTLFFE